MKLTDLKTNLEKIKSKDQDFDFQLNEGANNETFKSVEKRLGVSIPEKVKIFFRNFNGLSTINPDLQILPIEDWTREENGFIHFSTFNRQVKIHFDSKEINPADQWTITNPAADYDLTLTMSSFWSNKIFHWIRDQKEIWNDVFWTEKNK